MVELPLPDHLARPVVERVELPALLRDVQTAVRDRRRELEHVARLERPAQPEGRPEPEVGRGVRPLDAEAVFMGSPSMKEEIVSREPVTESFITLTKMTE